MIEAWASHDYIAAVILTILPKLSVVVTGIVSVLALRNSIRGAKSAKLGLKKHNEHSTTVDTLAAIETLGSYVGQASIVPRIATALDETRRVARKGSVEKTDRPKKPST